jgi:hypothetical protein
VRVVEGRMMAEVGSLAEGKEDRLEGEGDRQQDRKDGKALGVEDGRPWRVGGRTGSLSWSCAG